jgi:integrase
MLSISIGQYLKRPATTEDDMSDLRKWNIDKLKIVEKRTPGGKSYFQLFGYLPDGKKIRKRFESESEAKGGRREYVMAVEDEASGGEYRNTQLSREDERDAEVALKSLRQIDGEHTLSSAVEFFKANYKEKSWADKTIDNAIELYVDDCNNRNLGTTTLRGYSFRLGRVSLAWGKRMVADITQEEVYEWVYCRKPNQIGPWDKASRKAVTNQERNNEKTALSAFFSFCLTREWCESSPVAKVKASTVKGADPEAYNPDDAQQIMSAAVRYEKLCPEDESLVPCIAMGFFAGMRRQEIMRLDWQDFDWEEGEETIAIKGKGRGLKRRVIDMTPTCVEWVKPYAKAKGSVWPPNQKKLIGRIYALAGFKINPTYLNCKTHEVLAPLLENSNDASRPSTIDNGLRHSGLTYHLRLTNHDGETALWSGNSPKMIHDQYKGLKTKQQARDYWAILPDGSDRKAVLADNRWGKLYGSDESN